MSLETNDLERMTLEMENMLTQLIDKKYLQKEEYKLAQCQITELAGHVKTLYGEKHALFKELCGWSKSLAKTTVIRGA